MPLDFDSNVSQVILGVLIRSEMLPWDWQWVRRWSCVVDEAIYIHEISEGCVGIAVVAVSKYYYSNDILLGLF